MLEEIREKWLKEIARVERVTEERGMVDSEGLVTEELFEIFRIPRSAEEIELLKEADENGCFFETLTAIFMGTTREGEARTGANLYTPGLGLLVWNIEWDAKTKAEVWARHQKLKEACQDDLDFVIKLAYCFWKLEEEDEKLAKKWADYYFLNYDLLKQILDQLKDILEIHYRTKAEQEPRNLNFWFLEKVRLTMATVWPEKIVNLNPKKPVTYTLKDSQKIGAISPYSVGFWQGKTRAIVVNAVEQELVLNGYPQKVPCGSFLVQLPGTQTKEDLEKLLVSSQESFNRIKKEKKELFIDFKRKKGEFLEVEILKVFREPLGKSGWILGKTGEGREIPIEMKEMSLSFWGPGLELLEGKDLGLLIKNFDDKGLPYLSNLSKIFEDLERLREEISKSEKVSKVSQRNYIELLGTIVEINEGEEKVIVVVQREEGVVHSFEVAKGYLPGKDLKSLKVGEEVIVQLFNQAGQDEIPLDYFTKEQIMKMPKDWVVNEAQNKILVPFCLKENDLKNWSVAPEAIDLLRRHTWQYCLSARIRKIKIRFEAEAEISWSLFKYLKNPKLYNFRTITGKFIGKRGANIKMLIGQQKVKVSLEGLKIIVQAFTPESRDIVCERIEKWFKNEFGIKLKWIKSQKSAGIE